MSTITVIAKAKIKPGTGPKLEEAFKKAVLATHQEKGCLLYVLHKSDQDETSYAVVERWNDQAALDAHFATAHIRELFATLPDILAAPADISTYIEVPIGSSPKGKMPN